MAKIVQSDAAPSEAVRYALAVGEPFVLGGSAKQSFETDNPAIIAEARAHPWLVVEVAPQDEAGFEAPDGRVKPEDDPLSAINSHAFNADEIRATEEAKGSAVSPLAVLPAEDQDTPVSVEVPGGPDVAETLAADSAHTQAKSARAFSTTREND